MPRWAGGHAFVAGFKTKIDFLGCERSSEGFLDCWDRSSTKRAASSRRAVQHAALLLNNRSHSRLEVDPETLCSLLCSMRALSAGYKRPALPYDRVCRSAWLNAG